MFKKIVISLIFLIGIGIFSYPLTSNIYNKWFQQSLIDEYMKTKEDLSEEMLAQQREEAYQFNQALLSRGVSHIDPFSEKNIEKSSELDYPDGFEYEKVIGAIQIPKIDVNLPILFGTSDWVLTRGAGYMPNTSLPVGGESTHTVLTGHRGLSTAEMFRNLDLLEAGDIFYVTSLGQTLTYEVDQIKIVLPSEVEDLQIESGKEYATLITCEPYMINTHRMLVRGHRVDDVEISEIEISSMFFTRYKEYIYGAAALTGIIIIMGATGRKKNKGRKSHD